MIKSLLAIVLLLSLASCAHLSKDQIQAEALKAARCVTRCAVNCGAQGAIEASSCWEFSEDKILQEATKAAVCLAQCAIGCGVKAANAGLQQ